MKNVASEFKPDMSHIPKYIAFSYVEKDQSVPEAAEEEGEISDAVDKMQYDFDRLPEWPGFNVDMPENFRDESRKYNVPKMTAEQVMLAALSLPQPLSIRAW